MFEASTAVFPGYPRRVELTGSHGTLTLEHDHLVGVDLKEPDARFPAPAVEARDGAVNASSPTVSDATPHRRILEDFLHAIRTSGTPACDGPEGRRSVVVIDAIYASARAKGPVTIE